jgi:hypothetical protein
MTGTDRVRFCGECGQHVYNLSGMTAEQATDLLRQTGGELCVRFYRRRDGTMLTADCPVGLIQLARQPWQWSKAVLAAMLAVALAVVGRVYFASLKDEVFVTQGKPCLPQSGGQQKQGEQQQEIDVNHR